jgi:hypothetical protein
VVFKRFARGSVVLLSCLAFQPAGCRPYSQENGSSVAEYAVYQAVLKYLRNQGQIAGPPFLIVDSTFHLGSTTHVRRALDHVKHDVERYSPISIQSDLIADLAEKASAPRRLRAERFGPKEVILVSHHERWPTRTYIAKYGQNRPIAFSRVGFNRASTLAIVCSAHEGAGSYYVLVNIDGIWQLRQVVLAWLS